MNHHETENLRVKRSITSALIALAEKKPLSDITITELVKKAGVARASFYRNYTSKEDVLLAMVRGILDEFSQKLSLEDGFYTYDNLLLSFQYFQTYRAYVLALHHSGHTAFLLDELNHFHEDIAGTMPVSSIQRYHLYMYIGALLNSALFWLSGNCKFSPEEMADFFLHSLPKGLDG